MGDFIKENIEKVDREANDLFGMIEGQAAVIIAMANAERWKNEFAERSRAETFDAHMMCLDAAPMLYKSDKYLDALGEGIKNQRKYLLGVDRERIEIRMNLEEPMQSISEAPLGGGR